MPIINIISKIKSMIKPNVYGGRISPVRYVIYIGTDPSITYDQIIIFYTTDIASAYKVKQQLEANCFCSVEITRTLDEKYHRCSLIRVCDNCLMSTTNAHDLTKCPSCGESMTDLCKEDFNGR